MVAAKAEFANAEEQMEPAGGAPQGWSAAAAASVRELLRLESGSAEMQDATLTIKGVAASEATAQEVRSALRAAMPSTVKLTEHIRAREAENKPVEGSAPDARVQIKPEPAAPKAPAVPEPTASAASPPAPSVPLVKPEAVAPSSAGSETRQPDPAANTPAPAPPRKQEAAAADSKELNSPDAASSRRSQPSTFEVAKAKSCEADLASLVSSGRVLFRVASAELDSASSATLDKLAAAAKACPGTRIEIAGHASAEGSSEINQQLSVRRAQSVLAYLMRAGVEAQRLEPVGYGASRPVAPNDTSENMAKNRRIEFAVRPN
jgi:outer membrane protein OmpA-like peptidoglycan-associated protein